MCIVETKAAELKDSLFINSLLKKYNINYSSHAFPSLLLWQESLGISIYYEEDFLAVKCGFYGDNAWFFPVGSENKIRKFIENLVQTKGAVLCYIGEKEADFLKKNYGDFFTLERDENSDEYICSIEEHINMQGPDFAHFRRHFKNFKRNFTISSVPLSKDNIKDAEFVISEWEKLKENHNEKVIETDGAEERAFKYFEELGIRGLISYYAEKPVGIILGFPLSDKYFDIYSAKVCTKTEGFGYYIYHEMFEYLKNDYEFCNLEEDLGISGLRFFKSRIHPSGKNLMYTARKK